jgi:glycosyltransferase involved in cell wall biosynthesis
MRIGMVTATYNPAVINGALRMVALYRRYLEAAGHEVTIFTLGEPDTADADPHIIRSPGIPLGDYGYYFSMGYTREAQRLMGKMDILHCHHLFMSVELAHRYAHCPIIYTNHTRYDLYTGTYISLPQPAADAIMRQIWPEFTDLADVVIVPSESVRQVMLEFGVRCPTVVIENGIELDPLLNPPRPRERIEFGVPGGAPLLIFVGRLSAEKNVTLMLEQFAVAREIVPDMHLLLLGGGPQQEELEAYAAELRLSDHTHFLGVVPFGEVSNYLAAADFFVTASTSEVHPLTVIEAMAAGLPVVAPAAPGLIDTVVSGKTGYLTEQPESGLAAAMVALALDCDRRQRMAQAAREDACRRYDVNRTVALTLELYERLLTTRPDLRRRREHGRWARRNEMLEPLLNQLARLVRPPEWMERKKDEG